jgi:hypothetical protein
MATVLVEFEMMYHRAWVKEVEIAKSGMEDVIYRICSFFSMLFFCGRGQLYT